MRRWLMLLLVTVGLPAFSQDLVGKWNGILTQEINGNFSVHITIDRSSGKAYFGTSEVAALSGPFKGTAVTRITMRQVAPDTYTFQDESVLDSTKRTNFFWCKKTATLKMTVSKDSTTLYGSFSTPAGDCPPGTMIIKRAIIEKAPPAVVAPPVGKTVAEKQVYVRGKHLGLQLWDYDAADEDSVYVRINGKELDVKGIALSLYQANPSANVMFPVELNSGENTIEIQAKNEGLRPGNTVALLVTDGDSGQKFYFSLAKDQRCVLRFLRI